MRLYQEIEAYRPQNEQEAGDREAILAALRTYGPFLLERNCTLCHLTASGFIVSARGEQRRTLMVYHKIYRAWSWTGGHADENDGARWLPAGELEKWCSEAHMLPVYRKCLARLKQPGFGG